MLQGQPFTTLHALRPISVGSALHDARAASTQEPSNPAHSARVECQAPGARHDSQALAARSLVNVEDEVHYSGQHSSRAKRCFASAILATALSVANVHIAL